jgi:hypothetical protein
MCFFNLEAAASSLLKTFESFDNDVESEGGEEMSLGVPAVMDRVVLLCSSSGLVLVLLLVSFFFLVGDFDLFPIVSDRSLDEDRVIKRIITCEIINLLRKNDKIEIVSLDYLFYYLTKTSPLQDSITAEHQLTPILFSKTTSL